MRLKLTQFTNSAASEDGSHIHITAKTADGGEAELELPADEATVLIDLAAAANAQCELITNSEELPAASVSWFELGDVEEGEELFFSLTFGSGGRLNFVLDPTMAMQLAAALHARLHPPQAPS